MMDVIIAKFHFMSLQCMAGRFRLVRCLKNFTLATGKLQEKATNMSSSELLPTLIIPVKQLHQLKTNLADRSNSEEALGELEPG